MIITIYKTIYNRKMSKMKKCMKIIFHNKNKILNMWI